MARDIFRREGLTSAGKGYLDVTYGAFVCRSEHGEIRVFGGAGAVGWLAVNESSILDTIDTRVRELEMGLTNDSDVHEEDLCNMV